MAGETTKAELALLKARASEDLAAWLRRSGNCHVPPLPPGRAEQARRAGEACLGAGVPPNEARAAMADACGL